MGTILRLAWRNIWRNRRRSLISIASVLFAVLAAMLMRSMQLGFYGRSIDNVVSFFTGYLQIHAPGYWELQTLDKSLELSDSLTACVLRTRGVTCVAPRLESFELVSGGRLTEGAMVVGMDPEAENRMIRLKNKLSGGEYLRPVDNRILLAEGLASHLGLGVGDTAVLFGQGYHGILAAGKYPVAGTVRYPVPDLNNGLAILPLEQAQVLFGAEGRITSLAVTVDGPKRLSSVLSDLKKRFGQRVEILSWEEMMPELVQAIQTDNAGGLIMIFILYMVIAFGILGTVLMMTLERTREFGVLMAVGMKRGILRAVILIESVLLSIIGTAAGILASLPVILYLHVHPLRLHGRGAEATLNYGFEPIFPFSTDPSIFLNQACVVLAIAILASVYPLWRISRMDPVISLRSG